VLRSLHPTHPIMALGPKAEWLVAGHEDCPYPCGAGSPFGKFLALGGKILFFGVTEYHFTFHHYLEDMIRDRLPFELYEGQPFAAKVIDAQGAARTVSVYAFTKEAISRRRVGVLFDELTRRGRLLRSRIGNTQMVLMAAASTVECTRELADRGVYFYEMPGQAGLRWLRRVKDGIDEFRLRRNLSPAGKAELKRDRQGLLAEDPGSEKAMAAAMDWLCRAQDDSASADGGVARDFSLLKGFPGIRQADRIFRAPPQGPAYAGLAASHPIARGRVPRRQDRVIARGTGRFQYRPDPHRPRRRRT
jgi:hypothetical protein